ncbi:MAG: hypothetical protein OQK75_00465 [Gammaproteobacteria bacterium]|nr:hypothetical protein [Gammaproteobacteria bacterium]MCW8986117.1 hypothetical protein [Gammaproteobacteria bacterium]MCW9031907.1 hypothetical protein [Gammaproteobacteria bacterium]
MKDIAEQGSRILDAMADINDLLRLSHEALHRLKQEVHGSAYDSAEILSLKLHDLRHEAEILSTKIDSDVKEMETKAYG